jgi:hypothetical protein
MSQIVFRCPHCSRSLQIEAVHAGVQVGCPGCGEYLTVPTPTSVTQVAGVTRAAGRTGRPPSVTVLGIVSIVIASFGLMCAPFGLYGFVAADESPDKYAFVPRFWEVVSVIELPLASLWLLATGIGLLGLRAWARVSGIVYGFYGIIFELVTIGMIVIFAMPELQSLTGTAPSEGAGSAVVKLVVGVLGSLVSMVLPILLIVFMSKPKAAAACVK